VLRAKISLGGIRVGRFLMVTAGCRGPSIGRKGAGHLISPRSTTGPCQVREEGALSRCDTLSFLRITIHALCSIARKPHAAKGRWIVVRSASRWGRIVNGDGSPNSDQPRQARLGRSMTIFRDPCLRRLRWCRHQVLNSNTATSVCCQTGASSPHACPGQHAEKTPRLSLTGVGRGKERGAGRIPTSVHHFARSHGI